MDAKERDAPELYRPLCAALADAERSIAEAAALHGACPGCRFCDDARGVLYSLRTHLSALAGKARFGKVGEARPSASGELLTTDEASDYLGVSHMTVYRMYYRRQLHKTKVGRLTRWHRRELDRFIMRNTKGARRRK
jgi:excisionase family DNA binding protein